MFLTVMRYLLVAPDKSSQFPVDIPNEIIAKSKTKSPKNPRIKTPTKKVKRNSSKSKQPLVKKRKQSAKVLAK